MIFASVWLAAQQTESLALGGQNREIENRGAAWHTGSAQRTALPNCRFESGHDVAQLRLQRPQRVGSGRRHPAANRTFDAASESGPSQRPTRVDFTWGLLLGIQTFGSAPEPPTSGAGDRGVLLRVLEWPTSIRRSRLKGPSTGNEGLEADLLHTLQSPQKPCAAACCNMLQRPKS